MTFTFAQEHYEAVMNFTFKKLSKEEMLKEQYADLMKKSYKKALKDKAQSDNVKKKAAVIYGQILELQGV